MKYFVIDGTINADLKQRFVDFINQNEGCTIYISVNSMGGNHHDMLTMVSIINANHEKFIVKAIAVWSAAFELFRLVKCKKEMSSLVIGMYHFSYDSMEVDIRGKVVYTSDKFKVNEYKSVWLPMEKKCAKSFMTKKEYKKLKKGRDVYFGSERMKQIFPDAKIVE